MSVDTHGDPRLATLTAEFVSDFLTAPKGQAHARLLRDSRAEGRKNYDAIVAAADAGEDVTDRVLSRLLPHANTTGNRERGSWISVAPAITKDTKQFFEGAGWAKAEDWPAIAIALLELFRGAAADPGQLAAACQSFADSPWSKGFGGGMLSPMLSALRPDDYALVNSKPVKVLGHFAASGISSKVADYPAANATVHAFVAANATLLADDGGTGLSALERFDMFCHWLVAEKKYDTTPRQIQRPGWRRTLIELDAESFHQLVDAEPERKRLASPFDKWFADFAEAERVFNLGARVLEHLGVTTDDRRLLCVTLRPDKGLRISYGHWLVFEWHGRREVDPLVLALGKGRGYPPGVTERWKPFGDSPDVQVHNVAQALIDPLADSVWAGACAAMDRARELYGSRKATPFKWASSAELEDVLFDAAARSRLLTEGFSEPTSGRSPDPNCPFTLRSFELFAGLTATPRRSYYHEHEAEFRQHAEGPLKELFAEVATRLPPPMTDHLETARRLLGKIPKSDWRQGQAWDFLWGAFYQKGTRQAENAQLYVRMHKDGLRYGFAFGHLASEQRARFVRNCNRLRPTLLKLLGAQLADLPLVYGLDDDTRATEGTTLADWLSAIDSASDDVHVPLTIDAVLAKNRAALVEAIAGTFQALFPLVLLATEDDPLPAVQEFLDAGEPIESNPRYSLADCAEATGLDLATLTPWVAAIHRKGQAILYGPPGTGKTYAADKLARHLIAEGDGFMDLVQFHPAYAYEDFIQGIRPQARADGSLDYPVVPGRFLEFCRKARRRVGVCVLIVDEINRANLARVFGELMYLLEYRNETVPLAGGNRLAIPSNVRLIGTMNTADRSIALVDHALRRRFAFLGLYPQYQVLERFHADSTGFKVAELVRLLKEVNLQIADRHYEIGISFFLVPDLAVHLADIWTLEIEPYLEEYFFDRAKKAEEFAWGRVRDRVLG